MKIMISLCMMFLCIFPFQVTIQSTNEGFIIDEAGNLICYEGQESEIEIPSEVVTIKAEAFYGNSYIKHVKMSNQVKVIEKEAFAYCENLQSIALSSQLETIGAEAFMYTKSLEAISIPASLKASEYCEQGYFYQSGLKKVFIEEGMQELPYYLFKNASSLQEVVFASTITKIQDGAFYNCDGLKTIKLPDQLTYLGDNVFYHCDRLSKVNLPTHLEYMGADVFQNCISLTSIHIPKSLTRIAYTSDGIFAGTALNNVTFEEGITIIPQYLFKGATNLTSIQFPEKLERINDGAFYGCDGLSEVSLPASFQHLRRHAFASCKGLKAVTGLDALTYLDEKAFSNSDQICLYIKENTLAHQIAQTKGWNYVVAVQPESINHIEILQINNTTVQLKWESNDLNDGYEIEYYEEEHPESTQSTYSKDKEVCIEDLQTNRSYIFQVRALNDLNPVYIYSDAFNKQYTMHVGSVEILKVEQASSTALRITWEKSSDAEKYELYRSTSYDGRYYLVGTYDASKTSAIIANQQTGKTYYYKIREVKKYPSYHMDVFSNIKSGASKLYANHLEFDGTLNRLKWNAVSGASYYQIYRAKGHGAKFEKLITLSKNKRSYTLKKNPSKQKYYYKIRGYKSYHNQRVYSAFSNIVSDDK